MNGGYALIDCTGLDLNDLGTVSGLYEALKAAIENHKPIVLNNVVNETTTFSPIVAYGSINTNDITVAFYPMVLHVDSSDIVTVS